MLLLMKLLKMQQASNESLLSRNIFPFPKQKEVYCLEDVPVLEIEAVYLHIKHLQGLAKHLLFPSPG